MPVTYNPILDSEIDPESPVTESLARRWRDNAIAMIEGASGAPRATSKIITPGGSDKDGDLVDGTTLSLPGFFDYSSILLTIDKTFPWLTKMRVNGDVSVATGKTIKLRRPISPVSDINTSILKLFDVMQGEDSPSHATDTAGGGGVIGKGGRSKADPTIPNALFPGDPFSNSYHSFILRRLLVGGNSGVVTTTAYSSGGGGSLILLVKGDMDLTGATIDCSGDDAVGSGSAVSGGGGGGSIIVVCSGNIHNGTFLAKGGAGNNSGSQSSGGGGGGFISLIAASFTGSQTRTVTGGFGTNVATSGDNGLAMGNITLSEEIINSIMLGAVQ